MSRRLIMALVSLSVPFFNKEIADFWFSTPNIYYLGIIPLITGILFVTLWIDLHRAVKEFWPFLLSIAIFGLGFLGLALSVFPWIVPFRFDIWQAAASGPSLFLILVVVAPILPLILCYTAYSYYIFWGQKQP